MPQFNVAIRYTAQLEGSAWEEVEASSPEEARQIVRDKHEAIALAIPGAWNFDLTNDDVSEVEL